MLRPIDSAHGYYRLVDFKENLKYTIRETGVLSFRGRALLQSNILVAPPGGLFLHHLLVLAER